MNNQAIAVNEYDLEDDFEHVVLATDTREAELEWLAQDVFSTPFATIYRA